MYLDANAEQRTVDFIVGVIAWEITGRVSINLPNRVLSYSRSSLALRLLNNGRRCLEAF